MPHSSRALNCFFAVSSTDFFSHARERYSCNANKYGNWKQARKKKKAKESGPFHVNQREKKLIWKWKTVLEEMIRHALLLINLHLHGWIVGQNVVFHNASLGYAGPAQMCYSNIQTNLQEEPQESTKIWCSFCLSQPIVPRSLIRGYFMVFDVFIALNDRLLFTWFQNLNHKWTGDYSWT